VPTTNRSLSRESSVSVARTCSGGPRLFAVIRGQAADLQNRSALHAFRRSTIVNRKSPIPHCPSSGSAGRRTPVMARTKRSQREVSATNCRRPPWGSGTVRSSVGFCFGVEPMVRRHAARGSRYWTSLSACFNSELKPRLDLP